MKSCGDCYVCCHHVAVVALKKPERTNCTHLNLLKPDEGRCTKHSRRPVECRTFECQWKVLEWDDSLRPDRSGLLITASKVPAPYNQALKISETKAGAYQEHLRDLDRLMEETRWPVAALIFAELSQGMCLVGGPRDLLKKYRANPDSGVLTYPSIVRWVGTST